MLPRRVNDEKGRIKAWAVSRGDEVEVIPAAEVERAHYKAQDWKLIKRPAPKRKSG
jgi:hypothetical protein